MAAETGKRLVLERLNLISTLDTQPLDPFRQKAIVWASSNEPISLRLCGQVHSASLSYGVPKGSTIVCLCIQQTYGTIVNLFAGVHR